MPDCPRLVALADALEVSIDYLCGREPARAAEEKTEKEAEKRPAIRTVILCLLAALLLGAGFGAGLLVSGKERAQVTPLPDAISVEGFDFDSLGREGLAFHFVPSVIHENYTYQVSLCDEEGQVQIFDATPQGGICFCETGLEGGVGYTITLTVSSGEESRTALLCSDLSFNESGATWTAGP